jgi:hypothetical protein
LGKEGQGTEETDKAIPEAWNWKLKGSKTKSADMVGGMPLGSVAWGAIVSVERSGPLPFNAIKPSGAEGRVGRDRQPLKTSWGVRHELDELLGLLRRP